MWLHPICFQYLVHSTSIQMISKVPSVSLGHVLWGVTGVAGLVSMSEPSFSMESLVIDSFSTSIHVLMVALSTPSVHLISSTDGKRCCPLHWSPPYDALSLAAHSRLFGTHTSNLGLLCPWMHQILPYLVGLSITVRWTGSPGLSWRSTLGKVLFL